MYKPNVLFILKRRQDYNSDLHLNVNVSTGLYNSAYFMNEMMNEIGINSNISVVIDNNCIDREVNKHKPTHVIIEALWVVPEKFYVLSKIYPRVKWIIRLHSEIPFLSNEGVAFDWIGDYVMYDNVIIATNSEYALDDIRTFIKSKNPDWNKKTIENKIIYLPNYYPQEYKSKKFDKNKDYVDVSCFGAIRPLKNHIIQSLAAIKFAEKINKKLRFHVNIGRVEQKGDSILKNLQSIFSHVEESGHLLVGHKWSPREDFLKICETIDIGMQVSFSETFNIVAADLVTQGIPVVGSTEIPWSNPIFTSDSTDMEKIYRKLLLTYYFPYINYKSNQYLLKRYTNKTKEIWYNYFTKTT
jgi:hypothetical protein